MSNFYVAGAAAMTSDREDWETPQSLFDELNAVEHFTLDPASNGANAKCAKFYTKENSGLDHSWSGERVFLNPPYGRNMPPWIKKSYEETRDGRCTVTALVPARTDTSWFHDYIYGKAEIEFLRGRVKYELGGKSVGSSAPFPSMIVRWRHKDVNEEGARK